MNQLANTAKEEATKCFHGYVMKTEANFDEIIAPFPKWSKQEADGNWCAAFVYYCCIKAGYTIPVRPAECVSSNLAGCSAWEEWAMADERIEYFNGANPHFMPKQGDIVLFNRVFRDEEHDHIGVIVDANEGTIVVAEGNINNVSGVIQRPKDEHIRAYIRIPENFCYA